MEFLKNIDTILLMMASEDNSWWRPFHSKRAVIMEKRKNIIKLNVGGKIFHTTQTTLMSADPNSMLARMFANAKNGMAPAILDENGAYFLDRSPKYFEVVLNYLRTGEVILEGDLNPDGK